MWSQGSVQQNKEEERQEAATEESEAGLNPDYAWLWVGLAACCLPASPLQTSGCTQLLHSQHQHIEEENPCTAFHTDTVESCREKELRELTAELSHVGNCMWLLFIFCIFMRNDFRCFFYCLLNVLLILLWTQIEVQRPVQTA
ncbi:hypothetical protein NQZ68_022652 [Dissostichus eleginoides]|nr:hypothetical protein NQZ68_022652 [Dissostichus eleginoides]